MEYRFVWSVRKKEEKTKNQLKGEKALSETTPGFMRMVSFLSLASLFFFSSYNEHVTFSVAGNVFGYTAKEHSFHRIHPFCSAND